MMLRFNFLVILALLLSACASAPNIDSSGVDNSLTPGSVIAQPQMAAGKQVLWGGTIIRTTNLKDSTQMEVLAYPLDNKKRPQQKSDPLGRFIFEQAGYLEPESYAEGRLITVVGTVSGTRTGQVGDSEYIFPVIGARQVNLWPIEKDGYGTGFSIGVGGGSGGSWGGVGVGF